MRVPKCHISKGGGGVRLGWGGGVGVGDDRGIRSCYTGDSLNPGLLPAWEVKGAQSCFPCCYTHTEETPGGLATLWEPKGLR